MTKEEEKQVEKEVKAYFSIKENKFARDIALNFGPDNVFNAIEEKGYFEIQNPTVITSDGKELVIEGKLRINKLGE